MVDFEPASGRIVWHDLLTEDVRVAEVFYSALFGWSSHRVDLGRAGGYTIMRSGDTDLGGLVPVGPRSIAGPAWMPYIAVDGLDEALATVTRGGGATLVASATHPSGGRYAVVRDPQQGAVSVLELGLRRARRGPAAIPGHFCWDELLAPNPGALVGFYQELAGWAATEWELGELGAYWIFCRGERDLAGMTAPRESAGLRPGWLPYVEVLSTEDTAASAGELGGRIVVPPGDVPGRGRSAVVSDPGGALVGLFALTVAA